MGVNIVKFGAQTLLDMTDATATAASILEGYTAYGADGEKIVGTAKQGASRTEVQITIPISGWQNMAYTATVNGVKTHAAGCTVFVGADASSEIEYGDCGVVCVGQGTNKLMFECQSVPSEALTVNIVFFT